MADTLTDGFVTFFLPDSYLVFKLFSTFMPKIQPI